MTNKSSQEGRGGGEWVLFMAQLVTEARNKHTERGSKQSFEFMAELKNPSFWELSFGSFQPLKKRSTKLSRKRHPR